MKTKAIKNGLTDQLLRSLYLSGKTSDQIASIYGMTGGGILYRLKKLGIKRISSHERDKKRMIEKSGKDIYGLTKEQFLSLLQEKGERAIAKEYGCSRQVMKTLRDKFKINAIGKTERIHLRLQGWFTEEQESVLYGSILGDGNIHLSGNNQNVARYKQCHALKQQEYLNWKCKIFNDYVLGNRLRRTADKIWNDGRQMKSILLLSHYHKNFFTVYHWFYDSNGKKHLPDNFEEKINPLAVAVWYMDDGSLHGLKPTIASCFNDNDIERICNVFKNKFGIDCYSVKGEGDSVAIIHFDRKCFFNLVGNYLVESMSYKVTLPERFYLKCINKPYLENFYKKDEIYITDDNIDDIVDYCHIVGFPYPKIQDFDRMEIVRKIKNTKSMIIDNEISSGAGIGNDFLICCFENFFNSYKNGNWSAKCIFDNNLIKIIRSMMNRNIPLKDSYLRKQLMEFAGIYGFRPVIAKQIYDKYCLENGTVLDPCGGWGGRMLGAYCSDKVKRYDCMDACSETVYGLKHVKMLMNRTVDNKEVNVNYGAYEDSELEFSFYDLIFTSPPYFNKEFYSNDVFQSSMRYGDDYEKWKNGFLLKFIEKSLLYLKSGGFFIVNIDNIKISSYEYNISDDFFNYMINDFSSKFDFIEQLFMNHQNRFNGNKNGEPIFVFRKK